MEWELEGLVTSPRAFGWQNERDSLARVLTHYTTGPSTTEFLSCSVTEQSGAGRLYCSLMFSGSPCRALGCASLACSFTGTGTPFLARCSGCPMVGSSVFLVPQSEKENQHGFRCVALSSLQRMSIVYFPALNSPTLKTCPQLPEGTRP